MKKELQESYIVAYGRSAVSKSGEKGALYDTHPVDFGGEVLKGVLKKIPQLHTEDIDDVIIGCAKPEGVQGYNIARIIALRAGLPETVPGQTVNRFCASGLQTVSIAANSIAVGEADVIVAGGVESMSTIPMGIIPAARNEWIKKHNPSVYSPMGITAENVATTYHISREEMDSFSIQSHKRADIAQKSGFFSNEIIPVTGKNSDGETFTFNQDEGIRPLSNMGKLAELKTIFKENGSVTAGSSSQTSNGAAFIVLMSKKKVIELGIKPIAKLLGFSVVGVKPEMMGIGPIFAIPKVMKQTELTSADMDVIELNEAFAAQAIPCINELRLNWHKVNPNGGAIALGHPLGATGSILLCKVLNQLDKIEGRYGLISMCIGGGMGAAAIVERIK